jgi:hypothetical protein
MSAGGRSCWHSRAVTTGEFKEAVAGVAMLGTRMVPEPTFVAVLAARAGTRPVRHTREGLPDLLRELRIRLSKMVLHTKGFHAASPC